MLMWSLFQGDGNRVDAHISKILNLPSSMWITIQWPLPIVIAQVLRSVGTVPLDQIIPSMSRSLKLLLPLRFYDYKFSCIYHFSHSHNISCQSHPYLFDNPEEISWRTRNMFLLMTRFSSAALYLVSLVQILSSEHVPKYLKQCTSLRMKDTVLYQCQVTDNIILSNVKSLWF